MSKLFCLEGRFISGDSGSSSAEFSGIVSPLNRLFEGLSEEFLPTLSRSGV